MTGGGGRVQRTHFTSNPIKENSDKKLLMMMIIKNSYKNFMLAGKHKTKAYAMWQENMKDSFY